MSDSRSKSLFIAQRSIEEFFRRHDQVWFWSFTQPGQVDVSPLWTKDQAEEHFKPFRDLCRRKGCALLVVWELQKRGAWHPHCLVSKYFSVVWLRPWMIARGWGPQMRAERASLEQVNVGGRDGRGVWRPSWNGGGRIVNYLTKYLVKGFRNRPDEATVKKKCFSGTNGTKIGTTRFSWTAGSGKPGRYLYAMGRDVFELLWGRLPTFKDVWLVIRCGVEATNFAAYDFLWEFSFPRPP